MAEAIGLDLRDLWILRVSDGSLLRAYVALFSNAEDRPRFEELTELHEKFGNVDALRDVMQTLHAERRTHGRAHWLAPRSPLESTMLVEAAQTNGEVTDTARLLPKVRRKKLFPAEEWERTDNGLRLRACAACGSTSRTSLHIREASGYVCLQCRSDSRGVIWGCESFDRHIAHLDIWQAAGLLVGANVSASDHGNAPKRRHESRAARLQAISEEGISNVCSAYVSGQKVRDIVETCGLRDVHDVYAILESAGVAKRIAAKRGSPANQ